MVDKVDKVQNYNGSEWIGWIMVDNVRRIEWIGWVRMMDNVDKVERNFATCIPGIRMVDKVEREVVDRDGG